MAIKNSGLSAMSGLPEDLANITLDDLRREANAWTFSFTLFIESALLKTETQDPTAPVPISGLPDFCMWKSTWDDISLGKPQSGRSQEYQLWYTDFEPDSEFDNGFDNSGFSFGDSLRSRISWHEPCRRRRPDCIPCCSMGFSPGDHPWHLVKPWYPVIPRGIISCILALGCW
jgi:hypothetical protein